MSESIEERVARLHRHGVVDMHFDLPMDLYDKRGRENVLATDFLEDLDAGDIAVAGVALYLEDRYLPERTSSRWGMPARESRSCVAERAASL